MLPHAQICSPSVKSRWGRAVRGFLIAVLLDWVRCRPVPRDAAWVRCERNSSAAYSLPTLLLLAFFFRKDGTESVEGLGGAGRGCRIPFDGRPAVYARFGRELMRQESDDFSGERLAGSFGQQRVSSVDFGLPLLARGMGCLYMPASESEFM